MAIARRHGLLVVEDAAQGVCATYRNRYLGTIGHLGCYSFHETKNFIAGEGGALLVNDDRFRDRAEIIWEKGTDRGRFFRGQVDKYTWVDIGSSYLPGELTAAFLLAQLEEAGRITERRTQIWNTYHEELAPLEEAGCLRRPVTPPDCGHNAHMYYILLADLATRTALQAELAAHRVFPVFHYVPLHSSPQGKALGGARFPLPVTDSVADRLLRLPCYYELDLPRQRRIIRLIRDFFARPGKR